MNKKILIVEDDATLSNVFDMVLKANGFVTSVASNGYEALEQIKSFGPDVVLLDLLMPRMDGITFLKKLGHNAENKPRIIVFSNLFDSHKEQEVKSLGAVDIVLKAGITPSGLVELVTAQFVES